MVIAAQETLRCCTEPYDRRVAGVISGASARQTGLTLGGGIRDDSTRPLALSGTEFCKVDATFEPVSVGDLLTTSANPGHAMKASDRTQAFGCVRGKALGELMEGVGMIPILSHLTRGFLPAQAQPTKSPSAISGIRSIQPLRTNLDGRNLATDQMPKP
jgi:hypothetical protein